jgi:hypothetical protein
MNIIEAWQNGWGQIGNFFGDFFGGLWDGAVSLLNNFFNGLATYIGNWLHDLGFSISIPSGVFNVFNDITHFIGYIIPVRALLPIPIFMLSFYIIKLIFAIYKIIASTIIQRVHVSV